MKPSSSNRSYRFPSIVNILFFILTSSTHAFSSKNPLRISRFYSHRTKFSWTCLAFTLTKEPVYVRATTKHLTKMSSDRAEELNKSSDNPPLVPSSSSSSNENDNQKLIEFARVCGRLKSTARTGWVRRSVSHPESVADHSWRVSLLSLLLLLSPDSKQEEEEESSSLDVSKCVAMAVVHDLAEALVGDITPLDNVSKNDKRRMETEAMRSLSELLGHPRQKQRLLSLFEEYEERLTDEAVAVKDLDMLDMILQADEYERRYEAVDLGEFFEGTKPEVFKNERVRVLAEEIHRQREERLLLRSVDDCERH